MAVWALGLNHTTAPVDLRGRFAFALDQIAPALSALRGALRSQPEAAILSTCNRTEVYCAAEQTQAKGTLHWLAQAGEVPGEALRAHTYVLQDGAAARHAFRVASGLDSMVLGEAQILGQMKTAVRAAEDAGALGATLNQLFQRSFAVAKDVRTCTEIGEHSISMAAAAVRLAGNLFEDLRQIRLLLVGAGEMIELVAAHFATEDLDNYDKDGAILCINFVKLKSQMPKVLQDLLKKENSNSFTTEMLEIIRNEYPNVAVTTKTKVELGRALVSLEFERKEHSHVAYYKAIPILAA